MKHPIQTLLRWILSAVVLVVFVGTEDVFSQDDGITVGFIGNAASATEVNPEGAAALEYAEANYTVNYIAIADIQADGISVLEGNDVIWWHFSGFEGGTDLPPAATAGPTLAAFNSYVEGGGGLYLSGMASQLATAMGVNSDPPNWISNNDVESGEWGFAQLEAEHPIFEGLESPFYTVSPGLTFTEIVAWIDAEFFDGTRLATIEADPNFVATTTGEWEHGDGNIIFVSTGAYVFNYEGNNTNEANLFLYTSNILEYLASESTETSSEIDQELPKQISLLQNYPNPFNPTTNIRFSLDRTAEVSLEVYDMLGQKVASLISAETYSAGQHQVVFEAGNVSSGIYLYRMKAGKQVITKKMNLIK